MMGGIVVATVLTLLFLPALYAAWFRVRAETRRPRRLPNPNAVMACTRPAASGFGRVR